jgi:hypothetical protein
MSCVCLGGNLSDCMVACAAQGAVSFTHGWQASAALRLYWWRRSLQLERSTGEQVLWWIKNAGINLAQTAGGKVGGGVSSKVAGAAFQALKYMNLAVLMHLSVPGMLCNMLLSQLEHSTLPAGARAVVDQQRRQRLSTDGRWQGWRRSRQQGCRNSISSTEVGGCHVVCALCRRAAHCAVTQKALKRQVFYMQALGALGWLCTWQVWRHSVQQG